MKKQIKVWIFIPLAAVLLTSCQTIPYAGTNDGQTYAHCESMKTEQV